MSFETITYPDGELILGDNLEWMREQPDNSVSLIFGSPPYENARTYRELNFNLTGQSWVDWMVIRWKEMQRICSGLVAMVVAGRTENFKWTASPALLVADLHRAGLCLRNPPIYHRVGIPGSGGTDWFRNDYEWVVCTSKGKLPWAENTAMGKPPAFNPGGAMSHRKKDGSRVEHPTRVHQDGIRGEKRGTAPRYEGVEIANPGNVVHCSVGGSKMGSEIAHEGDAPFPEYLAEFFIRSCCPVGGIVFDPFVGTGTTISVARQHHRRFVGCDVRPSEIEKCQRRLQEGAMRQGLF